VLDLAEHLPSEAAEAILEVATGGRPKVSTAIPDNKNPFDHPEAQRRFRLMNNVEELERALDYPWEKWTIFLHPDQRALVERDYNGPARVSGSAGTGKTIVALHRAVFLARSNPNARVLLTTFSETLAETLQIKLRRLISNEPRIGERLEIQSINQIGERLYELNFDHPPIAPRSFQQQYIIDASERANNKKFSKDFLLTEWEQVVDAWQLESWEEYRDVLRLGRKTRLPEKQRAVLWTIFEDVRTTLKKHGLFTYSEMFSRLATKLSRDKKTPFDYIVVDESQDISIAQLRFMAALGSKKPDSLFFAGDLGQRIFQQPFSWKALGVEIRGRSRTLRINYRTSHQIRKHADRLLGPELSDVDGNIEKRNETISIFNGPNPTIKVFDKLEDEIYFVGKWIKNRIGEGIKPNEIGVFFRTRNEQYRANMAVVSADHVFLELGRELSYEGDLNATRHLLIPIGMMHLAKGLEFRAVAIIACDDDVIPLQERIESVTDESDLEDVYNTERHLLYVACTRARDHLLITSVNPSSEFLDDLRS
jgi:superfamily I DNA/RNA helicase